MHELSIVQSIIEIATEHACANGADKVESVTLRVGALSCVHRDALEFSFELATSRTMLEGARLNVIDVPVAIYCESCQSEVELPGIQSFRCPKCGTSSSDVRRGNELDVDTIEVIQQNTTEV